MIKRVMVLGLLLSLVAVGGVSRGHGRNGNFKHTVYGVGPASVVAPFGNSYNEQKGKLAILLNKNRGFVTVTGTNPFLTPITYRMDCIAATYSKATGTHDFRFRTAPLPYQGGKSWRVRLSIDSSGAQKGVNYAAAVLDSGVTGWCDFDTAGASYVNEKHMKSKNSFHLYPNK